MVLRSTPVSINYQLIIIHAASPFHYNPTTLVLCLMYEKTKCLLGELNREYKLHILPSPSTAYTN